MSLPDHAVEGDVLSTAWFEQLVDRLPGAAPGDCPVAIESLAPNGRSVRHTMRIGGGYVRSWSAGWDEGVTTAVRLGWHDTLALCAGRLATAAATVTVELLRRTGSTWRPGPVPPFDLVSENDPTAGGAASRPFEWMAMEASSPFGHLALRWTALGDRIVAVEQRVDADLPLRTAARYGHAIQARAGRRTAVEAFEAGGWVVGPDDQVEQLIELFAVVTARPSYHLPDDVADSLLALTDLANGPGGAQIARLLEILDVDDR